MILLGVRRMGTEDHPALIDAARELIASGAGEKVLPGPVAGTVEFWCGEGSEEFME
jgi:hypothetical protein